MSEKPKEEVRLKEVHIPCGVRLNVVYESIMNDHHPTFLVHEPVQGFTFATSMSIDESHIAMPLEKDDPPYEPYFVNKELLPALEKDAIDPQMLFLEVFKEFDDFLDLDAKYKWLEAEYVLESYQQHKMLTTGYLYHLGDIDSGKSRALDIHSWLDYRPMYGENPNPVNIYRFLGYHGRGNGTILHDEAHNMFKDRDLISLYNVGYRAFGRYTRSYQDASGEWKQRHYYVFSCKVFAGTELPWNRAFQSRCVVIPMAEGYPKKDEFLDEDFERFRKLRLKLLLWRMKTYFEPLPSVETTLKCRAKELWKPKLQIALLSMKSPINPIAQLSEEIYKRKIEDKQNSLEARICKAVISTANKERRLEIPFSEIWTTLAKLIEGTIEDNMILSADYGEIKTTRIGRTLGSTFGGEKGLIFGKGRTWRFKRDVLERLRKKYLLEERLWT